MQVTADGRPVIWHDDLVLSLPSGTDGPPRMHHISELTLRDFKKLSQHCCSSRLEASESSASTRLEVASGAQITSCAGEAGSQSAQLTEPAAMQAQPQQSVQQEQSSAAAQAAISGGSSKVGARLLRYFNSDKGKRMHTAQAWSVSEEDTLPTLAEVFEVLLCPAHITRWYSFTSRSTCFPVSIWWIHSTNAKCCSFFLCTARQPSLAAIVSYGFCAALTNAECGLQGVDHSLGFDIEVKMATPAELAVTPPQEVERMVGPILKAVEALGTYGSRQIVFSSFDPEICR